MLKQLELAAPEELAKMNLTQLIAEAGKLSGYVPVLVAVVGLLERGVVALEQIASRLPPRIEL